MRKSPWAGFLLLAIGAFSFACTGASLSSAPVTSASSTTATTSASAAATTTPSPASPSASAPSSSAATTSPTPSRPTSQPGSPALLTWNFDGDQPGDTPLGSTVFSGSWIVRTESDTPSRPNALCSVYAAAYPSIALSDQVFSDFTIKADFKAISGVSDQAAGIIFRIQDEDNYYIVRANALENNVNIYAYIGGNRKTLRLGSGPVFAGRWQELRVEMTGSDIKGYLDGALVVQARDDTFKSGMVGLWTKSDSESCFDNVVLQVR